MLLKTDVEGELIVRRTRGQTREVLRYMIIDLCNRERLTPCNRVKLQRDSIYHVAIEMSQQYGVTV